MNDSNGYYIPPALAADKSLSWNQKAVYAVYHYFTFYGEAKVCTIPVKGMSERLGIPESTVKSLRQALKEKGLIKTNGGTRTTALKSFKEGKFCTPDEEDVSPEGGVESVPQECEICTPDSAKSVPQECKNRTLMGAKSDPIINKRIKRNKEGIDTYIIDTETSVLSDENDLPFSNEKVVSVRDMQPHISEDKQQEKLIQRLEGKSQDEVIGMFDKFLNSIERGDFKGKEDSAVKCLNTFFLFIQDEQERDRLRGSFEEVLHPLFEGCLRCLPTAEEVHRQRQSEIEEELKRSFFNELYEIHSNAPTDEWLERMVLQLRESNLSKDKQCTLYLHFNEFLSSEGYQTLPPL